MADRHPQQQFIEAIQRRLSTSSVRRRDKQSSLEVEANIALMEAEEASRKPDGRCNVGYAALKNSLRR